jgi:hypothetical protein
MCSLLRWIQEVVLPVVVDHVVVEHKGRGAAVTGGGRQVGWLLLLLMAILFFWSNFVLFVWNSDFFYWGSDAMVPFRYHLEKTDQDFFEA